MQDWLFHIGSVHQQPIALGLERVSLVAERLGLLHPKPTVIVVAGTNGKGSTVAGLEAIYRAAHYSVGAFTTPMLFKHNEEVRVNGQEASDHDFCLAFEAIEAARGEVTLTPFEYHTLAALFLFERSALDVLLLEVGMGGRLDAVNCIDADVAVITSIDLDHMAYLGNTREAIGREKAGIMRPSRPVVVGDRHPPASLAETAKAVGAVLVNQGVAFDYANDEHGWTWWMGEALRLNELPKPVLHQENMSTVLAVVSLLQSTLPVTTEAIREGLNAARLPGRIEVLPGEVSVILDVSHNPHAVSLLAAHLKAKACAGKTIAVFSMLADKDVVESLHRIAGAIDAWFVSALDHPRASTLSDLKSAFDQAGIGKVTFEATLANAYEAARAAARPGDRVVVFGSFVTVATIKALMPS